MRYKGSWTGHTMGAIALAAGVLAGCGGGVGWFLPRSRSVWLKCTNL